MICPDCHGKKVIELWSSIVPCEKCNGLGIVADSAAVAVANESFAPGDWTTVVPAKTFDPIDVAPPRNSDFDDGFACYLGVSQEPDTLHQMRPPLAPGGLYQINPRASVGQKVHRCLGKELICTIDGFSNRGKWADLHFYYQNRTPSIVRLNGDTIQRRACLMAIGVRANHLYRVRPFKIGDIWEITIEGFDRQAEDRVARARAAAQVNADLLRSGLREPNIQYISPDDIKSFDFGPKGLGKTESMQKIMERVARPDEVHEYPFARTFHR